MTATTPAKVPAEPTAQTSSETAATMTAHASPAGEAAAAGEEPSKKKRGRPPGSGKKAAAVPEAGVEPPKRRGRPSKPKVCRVSGLSAVWLSPSQRVLVTDIINVIDVATAPTARSH